MRTNPAVITGVGAATPLGSSLAAFAANLLAGQSVARTVTDSQADTIVQLPISLADDPPAPAGWDESSFRGLPRSEQFALWCCSAALADAGYADYGGLRIGLVLGSGGEWLR